MALRTYGDFHRAVLEGRHWQFNYRRNAPSANSGGQWADLSFTSGNPRINAYAGGALESSLLNGNYGMWHGPDKAPFGMEKYLYSFSVMGTGVTSFPANFLLADYVMFYPLVDLADSGVQALDNVIVRPRYADGVGVRAMLVLTLSAGSAANDTATISYTNQDGVAGRTGVATLSANPTTPVAGYVINAHANGGTLQPEYPFFSLQGADYGIRTIETIQFSSGGFGGFASLVLVKPLHSFYMGTSNFPRRTEFLFETPPVRIYDGAYINLLTQPFTGSVSSIFTGDLQTVWG